MTPREWLAIAAVAGGLLLGLPLVRTLTARFGTSPEVSRKTVHVLMGLICISFPWIFGRALPVWILAAIATLPLAIIRTIPALKSGLGSALHGIKRPSYGEVLFAPAVAAVFHLSGGDPFLHGIPSESSRWPMRRARWGNPMGRRFYAVGQGFKTIEGSAIFWVTAFLCVFLPLFLGQRSDLTHAFWIALILATLAMMAEGISDQGFDNLIIPLGSVFVLDRLMPLDNGALIWRFVVVVVLLVLVLTGSRWSTLNGGALLGSALLGYGCAILADWRFVLPPAAVFICHIVTTRKHRLTKSFDHRLDAVLSHAIACLPWVIAAAMGWLSHATGLAGISFAMIAQLAVLDVATRDSISYAPKPVRSVAKGLLIAGLPGLIWLAADWGKLGAPLGIALVLSFAVAVVFGKFSRRFHWHATGLWIIKGVLALMASVPALMFRP